MYLIIVGLLLSAYSAALAQPYLLFAQPSAPPPAAAAGYNKLTFYSNGFSSSTIDLEMTYACGFQWYISNLFNTDPSVNNAAINGDNSVTLNSTLPGNFNIQITSAGLVGGSWVGVSFGGGAYFEATYKFNPSGFNYLNGHPSFWTMSIEHLLTISGPQWPGQAANYDHFAEVDFFEYNSPPNYTGSVLDWYGIHGTTCSPNYCNVNNGVLNRRIVPNGFDYNVYHKYGVLWVPATSSTNGSLTWYLDDVAIGTSVQWNQYTTQLPPPAAYPPISWTFGIMDNQHFPLLLGTIDGGPMTVSSVRVFQKNSSGNLVQ